MFRDTVDLSQLTAPGLVLDVAGGGEGIIGKILGRQAVSIDISREELEEASGEALKVVMDATDLSFLDGSFTDATCFFGLMFMRRELLPKVFSEARRVLTPGGRLRLWDARIGQAPHNEEVYTIELDINTGCGIHSTGYGVRWADRMQNIVGIEQLANDCGFITLGRSGTAHTFNLSLLSPYDLDPVRPQLAAEVATAAGTMQVVRAAVDNIDHAFDVLTDSCRRVVAMGRSVPSWLFSAEGKLHVVEKVRDSDYFIGYVNDSPASVLWVKWADPFSWGDCGSDGLAGYVHGFGTKRKWAGFGIGRALLEWTSSYIASRGRRFLRLECDAHNPAICSYYEKLGFSDRGCAMPMNQLRRYERRV